MNVQSSSGSRYCTSAVEKTARACAHRASSGVIPLDALVHEISKPMKSPHPRFSPTTNLVEIVTHGCRIITS